MRQRIVISGRGGQGVLTLTRVVAEAAALAGHEVITTETHGMAQRGGAVLSTIKVGAFHGPLIAPGEAEVGLFLHADNLPVHGHYLRPGGAVVVNGCAAPGHDAVDADRLAGLAGQPRGANLALLGYAAGKGCPVRGARPLRGDHPTDHAGEIPRGEPRRLPGRPRGIAMTAPAGAVAYAGRHRTGLTILGVSLALALVPLRPRQPVEAGDPEPHRPPRHRGAGAQSLHRLRGADLAGARRLLRPGRLRLGHPHHGGRDAALGGPPADRRRRGTDRPGRRHPDAQALGPLPGHGHAGLQHRGPPRLRPVGWPHRRSQRADRHPGVRAPGDW